VLTAARTNEALGAKWNEVDLAGRLWVVPAERMKAGREHRVPLSAAACSILEAMQKIRSAGDKDGYVFPGRKKDAPLSNMAPTMVLRRIGGNDITVHGFRSTFRDWCAEATDVPRDVAEAALAHTLKDKVEAAYRRGDMLEKRAALMEAWAAYSAAA
jgi:integrase